MTNTMNKLKKLPNKEEAYKLGFDKGFGCALGLCMGFLKHNYNDLEGIVDTMKESVLERKSRK